MKSLQTENEKLKSQLEKIDTEKKEAQLKVSTLERVSFSCGINSV